MLAEEKVLGIIKAVKENPFLSKYEDVLKNQPRFDVFLTENNTIELRSIEFSNYDEIIITSSGISFIPYYDHLSPRKTEKILVSTGWEDLCQKLGIN